MSVTRGLTRALVLGLCVAAFTAIAAILSGDFDDTDGRVIATSLGFAFYCMTAASGASLRFRGAEAMRALGLATVALSIVSFLLLVAAVWGDGDDGLWRTFGYATLAALAGAHASLVAGARRAGDSPAVRVLSTVAVAFGVIDAALGMVVVSGEEVGDDFAQMAAVLVVLLVLTTALPPILRRLQRTSEPRSSIFETGASAGPAVKTSPFATEVLAAAERIETLSVDPGSRATEIRRECERLRELAHLHS